MKKRPLILLLSFFILIFCVASSGCGLESILPDKYAQKAELTVSFIDVAQGDATLIECGGEAALIDAGLYSEADNVLSYLNRRGIRELKYCVATHPHSDHIGGMSKVIYNTYVDTLVYPLCEDSSNMNSIFDACDERGVSYLTPNPLDTLRVGEAVIQVLSPEAYADYGNLNNNSLVLKLEYENVSFLFMADAEKEVEQELLAMDIDLNADVLKAGHHGSSTSSHSDFINAVTPSVAIISCGKGNDYGHPHKETVSAFERRSVNMLRTDRLSTIMAESDGETVTFSANGETLSRITPDTFTEYSYTGNLKTNVFHENSCDSAKNMKEYNKMYFYTREDAVKKGYNPCKACNP